MPISTAIWILNHEKWVRDRGNAVVYVFSGLRVSMGEIRRKIRRARVKIRIGECGGFAPPNLEYMITGAENWDSSQDRITYTAFNSSSCDGSVHSDDSIDTLDNYISSEEFEPQSQIWTSPKRYNPTTPNANLAPKTWNNKCAQEILETYHEGIDIWHRTRHSEPSIQHLGTQTASLKFHEALFGFNYLHSPNDLKTRGAAYHLAECYAHLGQKEYFIAVLDWLGRELVRLKVMELFRVGGTPREAVGLLFTSLGE
ncbi:predicted protein [Sclerotinia sclerotiorum 1980 UF-70]|uniref:Uncharacterized protein n=1 Tax=Sclerotinia sclerotiorum (strain ATCC 18683 / 1980 / Ss-1) TaxID=665079 RepID=A7EU59_SCLS1|nr:predicted protein [Sclerotinia sclerotiorum 1980 UF-70]EDN93001.1 predicted protein [Sclerotinia sclerotiorum 1980 UF-70]